MDAPGTLKKMEKYFIVAEKQISLNSLYLMEWPRPLNKKFQIF